MEAVVVVLVASTLLGLLHRYHDGRVRVQDPSDRAAVLLALGEQPGERATLLQFSSAFCAPCRATRRVLTGVAEELDGVRHVEVDAESHLALVRELGVLKTPTTLVLDAHGREAFRASGQPTRAAVLQALGSPA